MSRLPGHSLRGECGLKFVLHLSNGSAAGHSLRGECGLKYIIRLSPGFPGRVTLCEESVDWNFAAFWSLSNFRRSLSARRVWIEISYHSQHWIWLSGHSLRGECGLKLQVQVNLNIVLMSLSARRVWIEIHTDLRWYDILFRHSLRGECGLKSLSASGSTSAVGHSLRGECGLKLLNTSFSHL